MKMHTTALLVAALALAACGEEQPPETVGTHPGGVDAGTVGPAPGDTIGAPGTTTGTTTGVATGEAMDTLGVEPAPAVQP
jgi:hypothetical protein